MPHPLPLLLALLCLAPHPSPSLALPAVNPLSITPAAIPASGNIDVFIAVPRSDVDPAQLLFRSDDSYSVTLLYLPGTVLPVPPRTRLQLTVTCAVRNITPIVCRPPSFSNSEATFQVTALYTGSKVPVALARSPNVPCVLQVYAHITQRNGSTCSAAGPCIIVYQGYGFNTDAEQCVATSSSPHCTSCICV